MAKIEPIEIEVKVDATQALRQLKRLKKASKSIWRKAFWLGWFCAMVGTWGGIFIYHLFFN
jgi:hypothetical protein